MHDVYIEYCIMKTSLQAFPSELVQAMRRGYYAAVSYTDYNIGLVNRISDKDFSLVQFELLIFQAG